MNCELSEFSYQQYFLFATSLSGVHDVTICVPLNIRVLLVTVRYLPTFPIVFLV